MLGVQYQARFTQSMKTAPREIESMSNNVIYEVL